MSGVWVERTLAARQFREQAGYANFRLNTIVVGLEAVKHGTAVKPADLAVHWQPKDLPSTADLARGFATNAVMVYVVDALDSYISGLGAADIWIRNAETASLLRSEFQTDRSEARALSTRELEEFSRRLLEFGYKHEGLERQLRDFTKKHFGKRNRPSLRARFAALAELAGNISPHYDCAVQLLISWRNRQVHGRATERVSAEILLGLTQDAALFYRDHAHLDVERMIANYDTGGSPTLKEVSSLISVTHRVVALIDKNILLRTDPREAFVAALRQGFARVEEAEARVKEYWGKNVDARQRKLVALVRRLGFRADEVEDMSKVPLHLPEDEVRAIAAMDRDEFCELAGIATGRGA